MSFITIYGSDLPHGIEERKYTINVDRISFVEEMPEFTIVRIGEDAIYTHDCVAEGICRDVVCTERCLEKIVDNLDDIARAVEDLK